MQRERSGQTAGMQSEDHDRLADEFEQQADRLARENKRLDEEIDEVRSDWEAKRRDPGVPGASPPAKTEASPESQPPAEPERD